MAARTRQKLKGGLAWKVGGFRSGVHSGKKGQRPAVLAPRVDTFARQIAETERFDRVAAAPVGGKPHPTILTVARSAQRLL